MRSLSRRALLRGGALGVAAVVAAGCAAEEPERLRAEPPDPETVLLRQLIAGKEQAVAIYSSAASAKLVPFRERHEAHLAELRRRLPPDATPAPASPGTPSPSPSATKISASSAGSRPTRATTTRASTSRRCCSTAGRAPT